MVAFDRIQRASFDGLDVPIKYLRIKGKFRFHTHEYLKTPGGLNEKFARGLYTFELGAVFDTNIEGYDSAGPLWPNVLNALRTKYERGITSTLVVPTIGSFPAFLTEWDQEMTAKILSGESAPLHFIEDQSEVLLTQALVGAGVASIGNAAAKLDSLTRGLDPKPTIFDSIQEAANSVLGIKDQVDVFGARVEAQILSLVALINEADNDLEELQNPSNYGIIDALHELGISAIDLAQSFGEEGGEARRYTLPREMSVQQLSSELYGDATHTEELMRANFFEDPFAIPAGTVVVYFTEGKIAA